MPNAFESEGNKEEALQKPQVRAVTHFPLELLNDLRSQAGQAATVRGEGPDGWTKSETDPMDVLAVFKTLRIKPGYVLRGYQFRAHYNGNGVVYALPAGEFPDPAECPSDEHYALAPPFRSRPSNPGWMRSKAMAVPYPTCQLLSCCANWRSLGPSGMVVPGRRISSSMPTRWPATPQTNGNGNIKAESIGGLGPLRTRTV